PSSPTVTSTVPLDLNRATPAELEALPGIGPSRAQAIVAQRERRPFRRVAELVRIRGIGRKTLRRLRKHLVVRRHRYRKASPGRSGPSE
ncbi:MAG: helix-hairpin-helix domain-containing protein, partial [Myxococcota bacterium]